MSQQEKKRALDALDARWASLSPEERKKQERVLLDVAKHLPPPVTQGMTGPDALRAMRLASARKAKK